MISTTIILPNDSKPINKDSLESMDQSELSDWAFKNNIGENVISMDVSLNQASDLKNLQKENERLKFENQKLNQDNQTVIRELKSLIEQVNDLSQGSKALAQNKDILNAYIKDLQALKDQKMEMELQCTELKDKMSSLKDEVNNLENEKKKLKQDLQRRKIQQEPFEEEKDTINRVDGNKQILAFRESRIDEEDLKNFYDCRIKADSFYTLLQNNPWPIEYKNSEEYLKLMTQNTTKVAALGYENTGKSFLLSKLTGFELPQGTLTKTVGLCLKYPTEKYLPWTALDTPGTNISVKTQQMKENLAHYFNKKNLPAEERLRMLLGDNILMENLLQEFVVNHAQVLLVVIGKLHRDDQRLVNRIKALPGKRIIIVHNLMDARNKEDVKEMIREDILETFSVTEKPIYLEKIEAGGKGINSIVYLENDENDGKAIEHIVMAHEGSPAGNYYNESAIYYIKTTITSMPFVKPFDLRKAFLEHLNDNLKNYLHSKNSEKGSPFIFENDENGVPKAIKLNDYQLFDLKLSSADEFGQIRTFSREGLENVPHTVKMLLRKTDAKVQGVLRVEFEIVGKYEGDKSIKCRAHLLQNNQVRLEIRGKSEDNTIRVENEVILENNRKFGDFTILTEPINLDGLIINKQEKCDRISTEVPGLMILSWNLYKPVEDSWLKEEYIN